MFLERKFFLSGCQFRFRLRPSVGGLLSAILHMGQLDYLLISMWITQGRPISMSSILKYSLGLFCFFLLFTTFRLIPYLQPTLNDFEPEAGSFKNSGNKGGPRTSPYGTPPVTPSLNEHPFPILNIRILLPPVVFLPVATK